MDSTKRNEIATKYTVAWCSQNAASVATWPPLPTAMLAAENAIQGAHCDDFDVVTNQKWDRLKESHSEDVAVHWRDGHVTHGIKRHIADLKAIFCLRAGHPDPGTPRQDR